ncbi:type VI secretion lipoprotein [Salmonella enterica subsp. enterica]|nr:type VI secretion lipoprotein [Salmonella enterica subsp. enterica]
MTPLSRQLITGRSHDNDKSVLTDDLVRRDSFILRPGEEKKLRRPLNAQTTAIGVLAGYRNLAKSVWRVTYKIPEAPEKAWYSSFISGKEKCSWRRNWNKAPL